MYNVGDGGESDERENRQACGKRKSGIEKKMKTRYNIR